MQCNHLIIFPRGRFLFTIPYSFDHVPCLRHCNNWFSEQSASLWCCTTSQNWIPTPLPPSLLLPGRHWINTSCDCPYGRAAPLATRCPETLFLRVSVKVFLDEVSVWIGGLSKVDGPPQCGWASSSLLMALIEQKAEEGGICLFFLCHWWNWDISSCFFLPSDRNFYHQLPGSQSFRCRLNYTTGFPGTSASKLTYSRWGHFSASILMWINFS